ncbi:MAG: pilus assembly protein [Proteobacteria bacterium]|nr:pilus assembly protein [Pseudomonadota bacterium]
MLNGLRKSGLRALAREQGGAVAVEYAIIIGLLMVLTISIVEFSLALWQWNSAEKSTELGVRYAVQSDPVAAGFSGTGWNGVIDGGFEPGTSLDTSTLGAFRVICNDTNCTCTGCPGGFSTTHDSTAFTDIVDHMSGVFFRVQPSNVIVEYAHVGMGFAGRPGGDIVPMVTVRLSGVTFDFMVLNFLRPMMVGGAQQSTSNGIPMPPFTATLSGEDMNTAGAS